METAEGRYRLEPRDDLTPDKVFEKRWALEVLDLAMARLRDEFVRDGRSEEFDQFKGYLTGDDDGPSYRELALKLVMTEGAVKVAVHRLRRRFHEALREEISLTVVHPDDIGDEIRHLVAVLLG
jgi:RNA polymerase sigma-70 factor (ECF subfamily)